MRRTGQGCAAVALPKAFDLPAAEEQRGTHSRARHTAAARISLSKYSQPYACNGRAYPTLTTAIAHDRRHSVLLQQPHSTTLHVALHPQAEARAAVAELLALRVFFEQLPSASDLPPAAGPAAANRKPEP